MRVGEPGVARWLLALAAGVAWPSAAWAQSGLPEITYSAPAQCPDRAEFAERVRARTGAGEQRSEARRLDVRLELRAERVIGQLRVFGGDGELTLRRIEAATCREAVDALALIAALTLEPGAGTGTGTGGVTTGAEPTVAALADADESPAADRAEAVDAGTEPAPLADSAGAAAAPGPDDGAAGPALRFARVGLFASGIAASGLAPNTVAGLQLSAALVAQLGAAEFALRAGMRLSSEAAALSDDGRATFGFVGGVAALCAGAGLAAGRSVLWGCFAFEPGQLTARGQQTRDPQHATRFWAAVGPGFLLQWNAFGPVALQAGAELLFPLVRDRYFLADTAVYSVPGLAFRAELGLGVQIW